MSTLATDVLSRQLRQRVFAPLASLRQRARLYLALDGLRRFVFVLIVAVLVQVALDWWLKLMVGQRALLSGGITLYWLWVVYRRLYVPLRRPLPDRMLAAMVDRAHPELHDRLVTAVELSGVDGRYGARPLHSMWDRFSTGQFGRYGARPLHCASPALVREVLQEACHSVGGLSFLQILNHRRAARCGLELAGLLVLIGLAFQLMPGLMGTWFARNWRLQELAWPQRTYILPDGFDRDGRLRMARGEVVEVVAGVVGEVPDKAVLSWWTPTGRRGNTEMSIVGERQLVASLRQLSEDVHFRIIGGDERTREYVIQAVERPRVIHTLTRLTPPAYTTLDPVVIEQQTVFEILSGATLEIEVRLNKSVKQVRFVAADGSTALCEVSLSSDSEQHTLVHVLWTAPTSGRYHFELCDLDGLSNKNPLRYTLKIVPDRPPTVRMNLVGVGRMITPAAELPVELVCEDAYGLGAVRLLVQAGGRPEQRLPAAGFSAGGLEFSTVFGLAVGACSVIPSEQLRIWAEAEDLDPHGPNVGATPVETLRVVSREEFQSEMARRELALRQEFERLSSAQRRLKDALDRLLVRLADGKVQPPAVDRQLAGLARSQREHTGRCLTIARGFEQVLSEMRISRVARPADEDRIGNRVIIPLDRLARRTIPAAAGAMTTLRRSASAENRQAAVVAQAEILRQMRTVLAEMLEWEGYREAIALLETVIEVQTEVRAATLEELERRLDDILGLDELLDETDPESPKP